MFGIILNFFAVFTPRDISKTLCNKVRNQLKNQQLPNVLPNVTGEILICWQEDLGLTCEVHFTIVVKPLV